MRGLPMALIARGFPGQLGSDDLARLRFSKTPAKTTTKATTGKTV